MQTEEDSTFCVSNKNTSISMTTFCIPVDLSDWSEYSACSESCGPGTMTKTRECNTGVCCGATLSISDDCEDNEGI